MASRLISPPACNLKWFPGAPQVCSPSLSSQPASWATHKHGRGAKPCTDDTARALCQTTGRLAYISWKHTLKADEHKQPANPASLFLRFFLVASSKKCFSAPSLFFSLPPPPLRFLGERQKKSHLSSSLVHAKIINAFRGGIGGATREERRQEDADVAPGLRLEIISEERSLGLFYSYQDSSYLTCILVFTQSPP